MKNNASLLYSLFLLVGDFLALVLAFIGAFVLRITFDVGVSSGVTTPVSSSTYLAIFLALLPFWLLIFAMLGLYNNSIYEKRFIEIGRLFMGSFIGLLFVLGYAFVANDPIFPAKLVPFYGFGLAFVILVLFRNLARFIRSTLFYYSVGLTNILIIGDTTLAHELVNTLSDSRTSGYRVIGLVSNKRKNRRYPARLKVFSSFDNAVKKLGSNEIHSIVQTELYSNSDRNNELLDYAQRHHIAFRFIPGNTELFVGNLEVELFRQSMPVIAVHQTPLIGWGRIIKRLFDIFASTLILVVAAPIMILITLLQLFSGGNIFFRQTRLTRFNNKFTVYKFRTVRPDFNGLSPEEAFKKLGRPKLAKAYRANGDRLPNDPRYGKLGNFLRKTSLDELPQLFNVLKGDLSLVGPRALVPEELSVYEKRHAILSVKSGLTGLAQVSGRRNISFDERRSLDMYYVQNWSFWLDIVILFKTVRVILTGY